MATKAAWGFAASLLVNPLFLIVAGIVVISNITGSGEITDAKGSMSGRFNFNYTTGRA
ncbi:MAG: hypothetical protein LBE20_04165 [Deltaproteobacteria bacterium]|nr:hypothetical protein [Deltaproteobacteria bacterium]